MVRAWDLRRNRARIIGIASNLAKAASAAADCQFCGFRGTARDGWVQGGIEDVGHRHHDGTRSFRTRRFGGVLCRARRCCCGGCFGETFQRGYVLPEGALEQIPLGASQEQVLIVLGTPSTVATVSGEAFYYISQRAERPISFMTPGSHRPARDRGLFRQETAGSSGSPITA